MPTLFKTLVFSICLTLTALSVYGQESPELEKKPEKKKERLARPAFENSYLINFPNHVLPGKSGLEAQIQHRFGRVNAASNDVAGIWGSANIRLGITYGVHEMWALGIGMTKFDRLYDLSFKMALMRQTRSEKRPLSIGYYTNFTLDTRPADYFELDQERFSYYHQLTFSRRFSRNFSLMLGGNLSHYNMVDAGLKNDTYAVLIGGRIKLTPKTSVLIEYNQPFLCKEQADIFKPEPGIGLGLQFATLGHAFQVFVTNYNGIVPQKNVVQSTDDFFAGDYYLGFNITRTYKFKK